MTEYRMSISGTLFKTLIRFSTECLIQEGEKLHNEVMKFIDRFTMRGNWSEVLTSFTCGCCYWFAFILCNRFPEAVMMYDPVINHFVTQIDGRLYDITGDVTQEYKVVRWDTYPDELEKQHIEKCCINF